MGAAVGGDRRCPQRGGRDRAPAREPPRARLPARTARDRRRLRRLHRSDERARRGGRRTRAARPAARLPARGEGHSAGSRGPRDGAARWSRSRTRTRPGPRTRFAGSSRSRRPRRRVRLRPAPARGRRRLEPRRPLLALRALAPRAGVPAGIGDRRKRLDLRPEARTTTSRWTRAGGTTSRSPTGWCRRGGARSTSRQRSHSRSRRRPTRRSTPARCACSSTAGRSPFAGRCCAACRRATSSRSSRTGCFATGAGCCTSRCWRRASSSRREGWPYALALLDQLALLAAFAAGVPIARYYVYVTWATVQALWNYLRRGVPAAWDRRRTR